MNIAISKKDADSFTAMRKDLNTRSRNGENFTDLMQYIISESNIMMALRGLMVREGSLIAGSDNKTVMDMEKLSKEAFLLKIRNSFNNYIPAPLKPVKIPLINYDEEEEYLELLMPSIKDRVVQQSVLQVAEPVFKARFNSRLNAGSVNEITESYGEKGVDILNLFNNIPHSKLLKLIQQNGVSDKKFTEVISRVLKSKIAGAETPDRGIYQCCILYTLFFDILLNDLSSWMGE